ncbi:hypothetical protein BkAM31D_23625 [Halalkalibacter krulwichiae]|uniref:Uncharacterized protein n=1 Tax=Halalkalibacter krulwichiae TaxID=199441 RepID=A0A1X9MMW8_9BACI|nr:hypothetical protein BkAM31D_23625 [Halalkalibacter krulwichiae]
MLIVETSLEELDFFSRPVPKRNWTIHIMKNDTIETVELKNVSLIPTAVDLFSDGSLLLVQSRCLKDGSSVERNARRYNRNGQLISAFTLGDGIEQMQIDETDTIWVSYFDEGVFGNFGWEHPIGSEGLLAFTKDGEKLWGAGDYGIVDCYALNVTSSKEVYFYYYADSYLVQLTNRVEEIRYRIEGETLQQFLMEPNGMIGQIDHYTVKRFKKRNRTMVPKAKIEFVDEAGKRLIGQVFMRGTFLYLYGKEGIFQR